MTDNFLSFIFLRGKNNPKIELPQSLPPIHHFYPRNGKHCPRDSKYGSIFVRIIPSSKNSGLALRERHTQKFLVKIPLGSSFFTNVALDYLSLRNAGRARRACVTWGFFLSISLWTFLLIYRCLASTLWGMKPRILSKTLSGRVWIGHTWRRR